VEADLEDHSVSAFETSVWEGLLCTGFAIITLFVPYLATYIGLANVARVGAILATIVAICLGLIDTYVETDNQIIRFTLALAPFAGISDGLLANSILAAFVNTTPVKNRGWIFGLFFAFVSLAFVLGIDHEGVLSSLGVIETTDSSNFILVCFIAIAISFTALLLISLVEFQKELMPSERIREILGKGSSISHEWWSALTHPGIAWGCLLVIAFSLITSFVRTAFVDDLEENWDWTADMTMNATLAGILAFLVASPLVGWMSDKAGSLKVLMYGNFALAVPLLVLAFAVDGVSGESITTGFIAAVFGFCSAPSVVISLIHMQENLEAMYENGEGAITATLYIISWVVGSLTGFILVSSVEGTFEEMALECAGGEVFLGIMAAVLTTLGILQAPRVDSDAGFDKMLEIETKKSPYVIQNDWDVL